MKKLFVLFCCLFCVLPLFASGIDSNSNTAPCTNNTLETYSGNSNLAADWQPNTINLTWYNENEKLTVQQSAQSCVYDGTLTVPQTPPTRTGYTFAGWKVRMPGTYTELEYIEVTTPGPYIDTGFSPDANTRVDYKVRLFSGLTQGEPIIGARVGGNTPSRFFPIANAFENSAYRTVFGIVGEYNFVVNFNIDYEGTFQPANGVSIINGTTYSLRNNNVNFVKSENNKLLLFGTTGYGSQKYLSKGRMYYVTIYDSGDMVRQFIPARRNSDNVVGMWDAVTQTFYTNAGSGTFVAGPVAQ